MQVHVCDGHIVSSGTHLEHQISFKREPHRTSEHHFQQTEGAGVNDQIAVAYTMTYSNPNELQTGRVVESDRINIPAVPLEFADVAVMQVCRCANPFSHPANHDKLNHGVSKV